MLHGNVDREVAGIAQAKSAHAAPREHRDRQEQEMVKRAPEKASGIVRLSQRIGKLIN